MFPKRLLGRAVHTARSIGFASYGAPEEVLQLVKQPIKQTENELLLRFVAAPVNPADINQIEGVYPSKPEFKKVAGSGDPVAVAGNEGVFEVLEAPKDSKIKPGFWVIPRVPSFGTWSSLKLAKAGDLISLGAPKNLAPEAAATLSVNPGTALRMLQDFKSLKPGDWFIQNGGNSGVGRMAIQLGRHFHLKSISVVRDRRDIDQLKQELHDLGADHVITEEQINDKSIKTIISDWTGGKMPQLALNCVGGRSCTNIARQLAINGSLVTYGGMSRQPVSLPTSLLIFKNIQSNGFWLTRWNGANPEAREKMIQELAEMFRTGSLKLSAVNSIKLDVENSTDAEFFDGFKSAIARSGKHVVVAK